MRSRTGGAREKRGGHVTHLVLEQHGFDHLHVGVHAEQLERQVKRVVDERQARVVGQREHHLRVVSAKQLRLKRMRRALACGQSDRSRR